MATVNYTVNQFALVDEKNEALTKLLATFSWQDEPLLKLSLPLFPQIDAISCIDDIATLDAFRHNLIVRLKQLKAQGQSMDLSSQVLDKLSFMWAAFFDERVIYESEIDTIEWENNTLVSQLFGIRNSGETFFTLVKQLMTEPSQYLELLQISYLLLQLGFKGKYHDKRAIELNQFIADVSHALSEFGVLETANNQYSAYSKVVKKPYRLLLKRGLNPKWFWITCVVVFVGAIIGYEHELTKIYSQQQKEYSVMAQETRDHLAAIQPQTHFIEQKNFIGQGGYIAPIDNASDANMDSAPEAKHIEPESIQNEQSSTVEESMADSAIANRAEVEKPSNVISTRNRASDSSKRYLVQLGVYDRESAAQYLTSKCINETYPLQFGEAGERTFVGYVVDNYQQAKIVSKFFQQHCQLTPYVKEYK